MSDEQLDKGETGDPIWDAAQYQLALTGAQASAPPPSPLVPDPAPRHMSTMTRMALYRLTLLHVPTRLCLFTGCYWPACYLACLEAVHETAGLCRTSVSLNASA